MPYDAVLWIQAVVVLAGKVEHFRGDAAPLQRGERRDAFRLDETKVLGAVDDQRGRLPLLHLGRRRAAHVGARRVARGLFVWRTSKLAARELEKANQSEQRVVASKERGVERVASTGWLVQGGVSLGYLVLHKKELLGGKVRGAQVEGAAMADERLEEALPR